ncbi:hypothetical protein [Xanthocytophaga agilis]|uniref:Uncharacterized protein n=1 Tax=Xanthocytophaga agilis TaxID=3048010 RepID=A0AAE3R5S6_9BACT|nr:hypothetical protein [Xanthocytophaga agilis]MDJ1502122.1 hypothetical protein [Xanthocytophaga agilis]
MSHKIDLAFINSRPLRDETSRQLYDQMRNSSAWMKKTVSALEDLIYSQAVDPVQSLIYFHSQFDELRAQFTLALNTGDHPPLQGRSLYLVFLLHRQSTPYGKHSDSNYRFRTPETVSVAIADEIAHHWNMEEESEEYQLNLDSIITDWQRLLRANTNENQRLINFTVSIQEALSA